MDMLVKLYDLPPLEKEIAKMESAGIKIIRAFPPNRIHVVEWIKQHSSLYAAGEADCCFNHKVPSIFLAVKGNEILGYACYNATAPDFFGPTRVLDEYQGKGIGKALLLASLHALKEEGYGYAIIGSVGPVEFYQRTVGAVVIDGSSPGLYGNMLRF